MVILFFNGNQDYGKLNICKKTVSFKNVGLET